MQSQQVSLPEEIAPGVWEWNLGVPEDITPLGLFREQKVSCGFDSLPPASGFPFERRALAGKTTRRGFEVRLPLDAKEKIYGLGLQLLSFNQTGLKKTLRVNSDPRVDLGDSHAPVPFYVSTGGYGVLIDTARYATFYCGSAAPVAARETEPLVEDAINFTTDAIYAGQRSSAPREMVVEVPGTQGVTVLIFAGPSLLEAVRRYNLFSGGGAVPPRWALGVNYRARADFNEEAVVRLAEDLRRDRIPCDVLGLEPGWQSRAYACSHVWSDLFPKPARLVAQLRERHYQVNLWTHAFTHRSSPIFESLLPHAGKHAVFGGLMPDFLLPEAERIFSDHYKKEIVDLGITGLKLDECDNSDFIRNPWAFPEFEQFPSGVDGEQMHSLFGVRLQQMFDRLYCSAGRRTYGLVRSSHAFASRFPFVLYSDLYDHRQFVRGTLTAAFCGLLWTPEIREATSGRELVRRLQTAVASSLVLINAWYIKNPPWKQWNVEANNQDQLLPDWVDWEEKCRATLEFRMRLIPYLQAAFYRYKVEGIPPFRPLVMDYPGEPESWNRDDQILLGDRLMAAPMIGEESGRTVWLPPGTWIDFWTGESFEGNQVIEIPSTQENLPLYVKDGSLLPLAEPTLHTEDADSFHLEIRIYGNGSRDISLLEESQPDAPFDEGRNNLLHVKWNPERGEVICTRARSELPALYSVIRQVKVTPLA